MLRVEVITDLSCADELSADWDALLRVTPEATYFQSLSWLRVYWKHYAPGQKLRLLVVRDGDEIVGFVPLVIRKEPSPLGSVRILTYPADYWGSFYGPIGRDPQSLLRSAMEHVLRVRRDWDLLDLRFAPPEDSDPTRTVAEMARAGLAPHSMVVAETSLIDLPGSLEEYFASRTSKWRNNYRRWFRRLEQRGELSFTRFRPRGIQFNDADPRWDLYDACEEVARNSWQAKSLNGTTLTHGTVRPFLRDVHEAACAAGAAEINLLMLDGRPLAFLYCYHYGTAVFGLRIGYDENLSRDGVGNVLYMHVIDDSIKRGDRILDLGPGSLAAKRAITSRILPIYRHTWGNPRSLRGLAWHAKRKLDAWRGKPAAAILDCSEADAAAALEGAREAEPAAAEMSASS